MLRRLRCRLQGHKWQIEENHLTQGRSKSVFGARLTDPPIPVTPDSNRLLATAVSPSAELAGFGGGGDGQRCRRTPEELDLATWVVPPQGARRTQATTNQRHRPADVDGSARPRVVR
jgi:hypothetical protein